MHFLPDNRPVTSVLVVEDYDKCPQNYTAINRSYDQDSDTDLYRENILFGKRSARYLCISKTEGTADHLIEAIKVIGEKELPPTGYSMITRTKDSDLKAWRKKQIVYKIGRRQHSAEAVTDIILCTKTKQAPKGFQLAGDVNGTLVCYKLGPILHRPPPDVPKSSTQQTSEHLGVAIENLNINLTRSLYPPPMSGPDYENIMSPNHENAPKRPAPRPPANFSSNTLAGVHSDLDGVPFVLNPSLSKEKMSYEMPTFNAATSAMKLDYDFHLERQILCTTKTSNSSNPFFH